MLSLRIGENGFTPAAIFNVTKGDFVALAVDIFKFQYENNEFFRKFCALRGLGEVGNGQNAVGNGQNAVVNEQLAIGKGKEPIGNRQLAMGKEEEPMGNEQWERNNLQSEMNNLQSAMDNLQFEIINLQYPIPFLPISFFKTHRVASFAGEAEKVFTSSGTTGSEVSRHYIGDLRLYEESFTRGFRHFYGDPSQYAFLCLLPSYLEREGSSLIYMAQKLIELSGQEDSGFFLEAEGKLTEILARRENEGQKTILLGVSFALLDFAEQHPMPLQHAIIMETGGMKGRRRELTRAELHGILMEAFGVSSIHSEYGMTELMSQAYSQGEGRYQCPPWMRVYVRDEDDPFSVHAQGAGLLCIADLANVFSCSFIETADVGRVFEDGSFEVLGRMDNSDIRGCSLLVV